MKNILLRKLEKENICEKLTYFYYTKGGKLYIKTKEKNNILLDDIVAIYMKDYILNTLTNLEHGKNTEYYLQYDNEKLYIKKDRNKEYDSINFDLNKYEFKNMTETSIDLWKIPIFIRIKYNNHFLIAPKYINIVDNKLKAGKPFMTYKCNTKNKFDRDMSLECKLIEQSKDMCEEIIKKIKIEEEFAIKDSRFIILVKKEINQIRDFKPILLSDFNYTYIKNDKYKKFIAKKGIENPYINLDNPDIYTITYVNKIIKEN